jgi:Tol biopolymer transport system component
MRTREIRRLARLVGTALLAAPAVLAGQTKPGWNVTEARGKTREIDFTTDEGTYMSVDLSPDGQWLVFDLLGHVYRMKVTGGEAECLTQASGIAVNYHPRFSPDGKAIAFISDRAGQDNLWLMGADGANPRPLLLDDSSRAAEPAWAPDGQSIYFTRKMKTPSGFYRTADEIWRIPRGGGRPTPIVRLAASGSSTPARAGVWAGADRVQWPAPTPDGKYLYFHSSLFAGPDRHLRRIDLRTNRIDDVTPSNTEYLSCCGRPAYPLRLGAVAPEVSPDGRWLTYASKLPGGRTSYRGKDYAGRTALWLRDLTTGAERVLMDPITSDAMDLHPAWDHRVLPGYAWARDGRSIVITQGGKLRRVWLDSGRVETIPFHARVHRTISEMARSTVAIKDDRFEPKFLRWPASTADGKRLAFEAVGKLWLADLPNGHPRPLLDPEGPGDGPGFELTPAWSPDGRWLAYTTWDDVAGGHLWRLGANGTTPERLTKTPGRYLYPVWSPDGTKIVVNHWDPALGWPGDGKGWELLEVPAAGGPPVTLRGPGRAEPAGSDAGGRSWRLVGNRLIGTKLERANPKKLELAVESRYQVVPSPSGRWAAVQQKQDVYLTAIPTVLSKSDSIAIDLGPGGRRLIRLTTEGGYYPRWRDGETLELMGGNRYFVYHAAAGRTDTIPLQFSVRRDGGRGTIALKGARLVTLDRQRVIDAGTIVVDGSRITCVGSCDESKAGKVVDVTGATIIPGLVDVHAHHLTKDWGPVVDPHRASSARYLAWGVTTAHDPSAEMDPSFSIGELVEAGRIVGPRTYSTGVALTCSDYDDLREIETYRDAEEQIVRAQQVGAISIKDYKQCTRVQREMLADVARKRGITITSEGSDLIYLLGLIMAGSTGWEHPIQYHPLYSDATRFFGLAGAHYSAQLILSDYPHGDAMEYWFSQEDLWKNRKVLDWNRWQDVATRRTFIAKPLDQYIFPILAEGAADIRKGGGYLAVGAHGEQDGLGTHWEMWAYGTALEPMAALEAAALDGAHFLGLEREIGSLVPGKLADLVVLDANPLENLRNSTAIRLVMKAGKLYDAKTLDEIWPDPKPYGPHPWNTADALRSDDRPDDVYDRR